MTPTRVDCAWIVADVSTRDIVVFCRIARIRCEDGGGEMYVQPRGLPFTREPAERRWRDRAGDDTMGPWPSYSRNPLRPN